jgi:hypothetical protein
MALTQVASGLIASVSGASLTGTQNIPKATLPTGSILQVVNFYSNTYFSVNTNTPTASGYYANITPTSSSSKILFSFYCSEFRVPGNVGAMIRLYRNGSVLTFLGREFSYSAGGGGTQSNATFGLTPTGYYLDSPATTSSTRYEVYANILTGTGTAEFLPNGSATLSEKNVTITLMEISA